MAAAARFIRQPPSPPQSTDGEQPGSDPNVKPGTSMPLYPHPDHFVATGEVAYDGSNAAQQMHYGSPYYPSPENDYGAMPMQQQMVHPGIQVNTPPPTSDDGTASGSLQRASPVSWLSPSRTQKRSPLKARVARPPRTRRRPTKAADRKLKAKMDLPLSEATKHLVHVPVRDMEEWVHRSVEIRHVEVQKRDGKVARPMNSFMLYRSAFAERAKVWFSQNNHQVVSTAAGDSWKKEPREVREKYELLAKIEKNNHLKAHPGYKFTPSKGDKDKKTRRPHLEKGEYAAYADMDHTPSSNSFFESRAMSSEIECGLYSRGSTPFDMAEHGLPTGPMGDYLSASWQASPPPNRAMGVMMSPEPSHYHLQPSIHPSPMGAQVEDVRFRRVADMPEVQYMSSTALAGLPGAAHHELMQPASAPGTTGQLDPRMLGYPSNDDGSYGHPPYQMWQETAGSDYFGHPVTMPAPNSTPYSVGSGYEPGMQTLVDEGEAAWDSQHEAGLEGTGGEFDHWINHAPGH